MLFRSEGRDYPQASRFARAMEVASKVDTAELQRQGLKGAAFGEALRQERIARIAAL